MVFPNVFTAIRAFFRWVRAFIRREPTLVSEEVLVEREKHCEACEFRDAEANQCLKCSCFLGLKQQMTTERCPIGKW